MKWALFSLAVLAVAVPSHAQFACTVGNTDEPLCINAKDETGTTHCVWCTLAGFGFCVSEVQAESMEQSLPTVACDRYSGSDDDEAASDDATPVVDDAVPTDDTAPAADDVVPTDDAPADDAFATDDAAPDTDDATPDTDDATPSTDDDKVPDNYWECLEKKTPTSCSKEGCVWCDTKAGFGLCLSGPSAKSAEDSDWFTCQTPGFLELQESVPEVEEHVHDPSDVSCLTTFLSNPTEEGCAAAVDATGQPCEWCNAMGVTDLCLTHEQAELGQALGVTCGSSKKEDSWVSTLWHESTSLLRQAVSSDPYDVACVMITLEDPSPDTCKAAVDSDGVPCEFCNFQGQVDICLTQEQAALGQAVGVTCDEFSHLKDDSCLRNMMTDPLNNHCSAAVDQTGAACQVCGSGPDAFSLCLTADQAEVATAFGLACTDEEYQAPLEVPDDLFVCLQNYEQHGCNSDECTWCTSEVGVGFCLDDTSAQALSACKFWSCDYHTTTSPVIATAALVDPLDPSCALAFLQDPTEDGCTASVDSDGNPCEFCTVQDQIQLCLNAEQAEAGEAFGVECESSVDTMDLQDPLDPSCALAFLQDPTEDGCTAAVDSDGNPCEFCTVQDQIQLCLNAEQAEAGEAFGVECESSAAVQDPLDMSCALAMLQDPTPDGCASTSDISGHACEYCTLQGSLPLCLNAEQAEMGAAFGIECDSLQEPTSPLDPLCLAAGMNSDDAQSVCDETTDSMGQPCVWCDAAGVYGLCLSQEGADYAGGYLECDSATMA